MHKTNHYVLVPSMAATLPWRVLALTGTNASQQVSLIRWETEKSVYEMQNQGKRIYLPFTHFTVKYMHIKCFDHLSESISDHENNWVVIALLLSLKRTQMCSYVCQPYFKSLFEAYSSVFQWDEVTCLKTFIVQWNYWFEQRLFNRWWVFCCFFFFNKMQKPTHS